MQHIVIPDAPRIYLGLTREFPFGSRAINRNNHSPNQCVELPDLYQVDLTERTLEVYVLTAFR